MKYRFFLTFALILTICVMMMSSLSVFAAVPDPVYSKDAEKNFDGTNADYYENFDMNIGGCFTFMADINLADITSIHMIFAKGPKDAGHYEFFIWDGRINVYSPELNWGNSLDTGVTIEAGVDYRLAFTYDSGIWAVYIDGEQKAAGMSSGTVTDETETFAIGALADTSFPFVGRIDSISIYDAALTKEQIYEVYNGTAPGTSVPDPIYSNDVGKVFDGTNADYYENLDVNIGGCFTFMADINLTDITSIHMIFAKGPKDAGHYEFFIWDGRINVYSPELNWGNSLDTGVTIEAGVDYRLAFTYDSGIWAVYIDGEQKAAGMSSGVLTDETETFAIGALVDSSFPLVGRIDKISIYNTALTTDRINEVYNGTVPGTEEPETAEPETEAPETAEPETEEPETNPKTGDEGTVIALAVLLSAFAIYTLVKRRNFSC